MLVELFEKNGFEIKINAKLNLHYNLVKLFHDGLKKYELYSINNDLEYVCLRYLQQNGIDIHWLNGLVVGDDVAAKGIKIGFKNNNFGYALAYPSTFVPDGFKIICLIIAHDIKLYDSKGVK